MCQIVTISGFHQYTMILLIFVLSVSVAGMHVHLQCLVHQIHGHSGVTIASLNNIVKNNLYLCVDLENN